MLVQADGGLITKGKVYPQQPGKGQSGLPGRQDLPP